MAARRRAIALHSLFIVCVGAAVLALLPTLPGVPNPHEALYATLGAAGALVFTAAPFVDGQRLEAAGDVRFALVWWLPCAAVALAFAWLARSEVPADAVGAMLIGLGLGFLVGQALGRVTPRPRRTGPPRRFALRTQTLVCGLLGLVVLDAGLAAAAYGQRLSWWPCVVAAAITVVWWRGSRRALEVVTSGAPVPPWLRS
jgi:hypothetical protein